MGWTERQRLPKIDGYDESVSFQHDDGRTIRIVHDNDAADELIQASRIAAAVEEFVSIYDGLPVADLEADNSGAVADFIVLCRILAAAREDGT